VVEVLLRCCRVRQALNDAIVVQIAVDPMAVVGMLRTPAFFTIGLESGKWSSATRR